MFYILSKIIKQLETQISKKKKKMNENEKMMIKGKKMRLWYSKERPRTNALNLMLESLNLRYSTWLSKSGWARKAVMPRA